MFGETSNYTSARKAMVEQQLRSRDITDRLVLSAISKVPRELFVPQGKRSHAYDDCPLAIGEGQTISQPYVVALMLELLELTPEDNVLEVGSGSGYVLAVLSHIAARVTGIEWYEILRARSSATLQKLHCSNTSVIHGDGSKGYSAHAPYDAIVVSAGAKELPSALLRQLKVGGRMVLPLGENHDSQFLIKITRTSEDDYREEDLGAVRFVPLLSEVSENLH